MLAESWSDRKWMKNGFWCVFCVYLEIYLYDCAWFAWDREVVGER